MTKRKIKIRNPYKKRIATHKRIISDLDLPSHFETKLRKKFIKLLVDMNDMENQIVKLYNNPRAVIRTAVKNSFDEAQF